jgi:hypothetical protein
MTTARWAFGLVRAPFHLQAMSANCSKERIALRTWST